MPKFVPVPGISYASCAFPNPEGTVAVVCLWQPVERAVEQHPDAFMVGPTVSPAGVDYVVRTLLANPHIRLLIIQGPDLSGTKALLRTALLGLDGAGFARPDGGPMIVLSGQCSLHDDGRVDVHLYVREPLVLPVPPPPPGTVGTRRGPPARSFVGASLWAVWPRLLREVVRHGVESPTAYGSRQRELLAVSWTFGVKATLTTPPTWARAGLNGLKEDACEADVREALDAYAAVHFLGTARRPEGVAYTYHDRLTTMGDDQIARCVETLRADPEQRRGVAVTWDVGGPGWGHGNPPPPAERGEDAPPLVLAVRGVPAAFRTDVHPKLVWAEANMRDDGDGWIWRDDEYMEYPDVEVEPSGTWLDLAERPSDAAGKNPPCLTHLWFRRDEDGSLYAHATFRSHDLLQAGMPNAWGLCRLAEYVAAQLGWPVGRLTICSLSGHVYSPGWAQAEQIAQERGRAAAYEEDDRAILRVRRVPPPHPGAPYPTHCNERGCTKPVDHLERWGKSARGWCERHTPWSGHGERCWNGCPATHPKVIAVDLLSQDGSTVDTVEGRTAEGVEREVLERGWITTLSHAAWLGRELARGNL